MNELKLAGNLHGAMVGLEVALSAAQDLAAEHFHACAGIPDAADSAMGLLSQITAMHDLARLALDEAGLAIATIDAAQTMAAIDAGELPVRH